jgi:hypothetical protein
MTSAQGNAPSGDQSPSAGPGRTDIDERFEPALVSDSGIGRSPVGPVGIVVVATLLFTAMILDFYSLVALWPPGNGILTGPARSQVLSVTLVLDREQRLFLIVALAGVFGGLIRSTFSMTEYVGHGALRRSWLLFYLSVPFMGGALAVVFYVILRGGLITGTVAQVNPFGFAAIAALVGFAAPQAEFQLKKLFMIMFPP